MLSSNCNTAGLTLATGSAVAGADSGSSGADSGSGFSCFTPFLLASRPFAGRAPAFARAAGGMRTIATAFRSYLRKRSGASTSEKNQLLMIGT